MFRELYVIEVRDDAGKLLLGDTPQPESYFGMAAIHGISEDMMVEAICRTQPNAILSGANVSGWPSCINPNWKARRKTW